MGGVVVGAVDGGAGGALCFRMGAVLGAPADDGRNLLLGLSAALGTALGMSTATTALGAVAGAVEGAADGAVMGAVVGAVVGADVGADVGAVVAVAGRGERGEPSAGDGTGAVLSAPPACVGSHVSQLRLRRGSASWWAPETALGGGRGRTREGGGGGWGARAPGMATWPS